MSSCVAAFEAGVKAVNLSAECLQLFCSNTIINYSKSSTTVLIVLALEL